MPKYLSIQIPEPCHEDWNNMTATDKGRFCNACAKTVVDFSVMTDTQVLNYFKKDTGNTCGRFYNAQIENDILIPKKQIPWLRYFFTITIPVFLFSLKAEGQKKVEKVVLVNKEKSKSIFSDTAVLQEVIVKSYASDGIRKGYLSYTLGGASSITCKKASVFSKLKKAINPIKKQTINIFPNPIAANEKLNITWANNIEGNQIVEIFSANGNLVQRENINIISKVKTSFIMLKNLPKGLYFFSVINVKSNEKISKEFIVL